MYYKCRSWKECCHKRLLIHNEIYFASSKQFNDPFDCRVIPEFDEQHRTEYLECFNTFLKFDQPNVRIAPVNVHRDILGVNLMRDDSQVQADFKKQFIKFCADNFGIFSLSRQCDNILMWSHYADSHKGFCVGFDKDKLDNFFANRSSSDGRGAKEIRVFPVEYLNEYPEIVPANMKHLDKLVRPLVIKSSCWQYEQEDRAILLKGTKETAILDDGIICEVRLGCKISSESKDEILEVLQARPSKVRVYQARELEGGFALEFEEVNY